jgi:BirA family transcriptional regulator, biotin operon repressor / biotin---[acetyl-CoA-carboxylase] ligase
VAEEQVAGRGRLGRVWSAPSGCCILCSVLLRPRFPPGQAFYLTIAASLAIYRACHALLNQHRVPSTEYRVGSEDNSVLGTRYSVLGIKWPNDVLVSGRKVAGILCESEFSGQGWDFAALGFGINANLRPDELEGALREAPPRTPATSLSAELGSFVDRAALLAHVLDELESLYLALQNGQFGSVHAEWVAVLETIGKQVTVQEPAGTFTGKALRVDPDGALVLRLQGGERRILAGDVT